MFHTRRILCRPYRNCTSFAIRNFNVAVVGGASEIGQTVCMLLKSQPNISKLTVYDTAPSTAGIVLDLSHIPTEAFTKCYTVENDLEIAIKDAHLILAIGGVAQTPTMSKKSLVTANMEFITALCRTIAKRPMPFVGIVTEPINTLVPVAAEVLKTYGDYDPKKLFGITGIDALRAQALFAAEHKLSPNNCYVPVVGGHTEKTMIPLASKSTPKCKMNMKRIHEFSTTLRKAEDIIITAKKGYSPTLSPACSVLLFTHEILNALKGNPAQVHAYIENNDFGTSYFSGLVNLDRNGAVDMQRYTNLSQYEFQLLEQSIIELRREIYDGRKILEMA